MTNRLRLSTTRDITDIVKGYQPMDSFGEDAAAVYDAEPRGDEMSTVALLDELAHGGPSPELAIGTGRIALPLAARGIRVDGVDLSPAMVARLRAKPGGKHLSITIGDLADVPVEGSYKLIVIVFNTLFNLLNQEEQVRCFENVADHLTDDGLFILEAFVPSYLNRLRDDQYVDAEHVGVDHVRFDVGCHDPVTQRLNESHAVLSPEGLRFFREVCDPLGAGQQSDRIRDLVGYAAGFDAVGEGGCREQVRPHDDAETTTAQ